jgi:hypothetical protein
MVAVGAFLGNVDKIIEFAKKYGAPIFASYSSIRFTVEAIEGLDVRIAILKKEIIASEWVGASGEVQFKVPASQTFELLYSGPSIEAGKLSNIDSGPSGSVSRWLLRPNRTEEKFATFQVFRMREQGQDQLLAVSPAPAELLVADARRQQRINASTNEASSFPLPEITRLMMNAMALTGLLEVGRADCWGLVAASRYSVNIGCLGHSFDSYKFPGICRSLNEDNPELLRAIFGDGYQPLINAMKGSSSDRGEFIRSMMSTPESRALWNARFSEFTASPSVQVALWDEASHLFMSAVQFTEKLGLKSERAVAFVFDSMVFRGIPMVKRFTGWLGKNSEDFYGMSEQKKLAKLGEYLTARSGPSIAIEKWVKKRAAVFVTGHGTLNGVEYDLDTLGLRLRDFRTGKALP